MRRWTILPKLNRMGTKTQLMAVLREQGYEAAVSDLVAATGIPAREVEAALNLLSWEYSGSQRVTESGEVLYGFPSGFSGQPRASVRDPKLYRGIRRTGGAFLRWIKNRWPLFLLGGYFTAFLALPFPPALIILAALMSTWSDLSYLDMYGRSHQARQNGPLRVHETLYEYLFGSTDASARSKREQLLLILSFIRGHKGFASLEDIMTLTGQSPAGSQEFLSELLVAYSGEPEVTDAGTVVYHFRELMKTVTSKIETNLPAASKRDDPLLRRDNAQRKKTRLVGLANLSNLLFAAYYGVTAFSHMTNASPVPAGADPLHPGNAFLFNATYSFLSSAHVASVLPIMFLFLGVVPFAVSSSFFVLHRLAVGRGSASLREQGQRYLRKEVYSQVFSHPQHVDPERIVVRKRIPLLPGGIRKEVVRILDELAAAFSAEVEDLGDGHYVYHFTEFQYEITDVERLRDSTDLAEFDVGPVIFDTRDRVK